MTGALETTDLGTPAPKHFRIPGENYLESMTPVFRYEQVFNENKSLEAGHEIHDLKEVVEFRLAGTNQYRPVFPVDAIYRTINGRPITFAERWKDAYQQFLTGEAQNAIGTPLEELKGYGITPSQLSLCRAHNIYSIEAVDQLQGPGLKKLGINGAALKEMAQRWIAARRDNSDELEALRARIAQLEAEKPAPAVSDIYETLTDEEIKARIADVTGSRPRGNPSRETLLSLIRGLE